MKTAQNIIYCSIVSLITSIIVFYPGTASAEVDVGNGLLSAIPMAINSQNKEEVNFEICPQGARNVQLFLGAWGKGDYETMYLLLDKESIGNRSLDDLKFTFQFLEYKEYQISAIRKSGENFDFMLSFGKWRHGDKDVKKMLVSGKNFKIIMQSFDSPFKTSIVNNF